MTTLSPCPDCGLPPRYLVAGKWATADKVMVSRAPLSQISVHPQHRRWCPSTDNWSRNFRLTHRA